jgi:hypothetical protein
MIMVNNNQRVYSIIVLFLFCLTLFFSLSNKNNTITGFTTVLVDRVINNAIKEASEYYGIQEEIIKAQIKAESNFNPLAISGCGAAGLIQLMPGVATDLGLKTYKNWKFNSCSKKKATELKNFIKGKSLDEIRKIDERFDIEKNINAGVKYLKQQLDKFNDIELALAAYNTGPHGVWKSCNCDKSCHSFEVCKFDLPEETRDYIEKIIDYMGPRFKYVSSKLKEELRRKKLKIIGEYSIKPNFRIEIKSTIIDDIEKIKELLVRDNKVFFSNIQKCEEKKENNLNLKDCINLELLKLNKINDFKWSINCDKDEDKIFYDFVEYFIRCANSKDNDCYCPKNYFGAIFNIKKVNNGVVISSKINNKEYSELIKGINIKEENSIFVPDTTYIKKEKDKISISSYWPKEQCRVAEKRIYKFCVNTTKKNLFYNKEIDKLEEKDIVIKFALYFQK